MHVARRASEQAARTLVAIELFVLAIGVVSLVLRPAQEGLNGLDVVRHCGVAQPARLRKPCRVFQVEFYRHVFVPKLIARGRTPRLEGVKHMSVPLNRSFVRTMSGYQAP